MNYLLDTNRRGTCRKTCFTQKLFDGIQERSHYGDVKFAEVRSFLKGFPFEELVSRHRTCYQETTHSGMIKRAKERYETELCGPNEAR